MPAGSAIVTNDEHHDGFHYIFPSLPDPPVKLGVINAIWVAEPLFRKVLGAKIYRMRRDRDQFFPLGLFGEPAWDVLLLLYGIELRPERLSVSAICSSSSGAPPTTTVRWIEKLEQANLLIRQSHPTDRRVSVLRLSDQGQQLMNRYFDGALAPQNGALPASAR